MTACALILRGWSNVSRAGTAYRFAWLHMETKIRCTSDHVGFGLSSAKKKIPSDFPGKGFILSGLHRSIPAGSE